jgi:hypothetical protein
MFESARKNRPIGRRREEIRIDDSPERDGSIHRQSRELQDLMKNNLRQGSSRSFFGRPVEKDSPKKILDPVLEKGLNMT